MHRVIIYIYICIWWEIYLFNLFIQREIIVLLKLNNLNYKYYLVSEHNIISYMVTISIIDIITHD
jgi:hypothetical protein